MEPIPREPVLYMVLGLAAVGLMVLLLPFFVRKIEQNLQLFFLVMGIIAVTISGLWSIDLVVAAIKSPVLIGRVPVGIFQVVLLFGIVIHYFNKPFYSVMVRLANKLGFKTFTFLFILVLGLLSSVISVIVTATIMAEIIAALPVDKSSKVKLAVVTCFAAGIGAVLTPIGEPLSTILVHKLAGSPYYADFFFPIRIFAKYIVPGVVGLALFGAFYCGRGVSLTAESSRAVYTETLRSVIVRAVKVFAFIIALTLLGEGLRPIVVWYFGKIPPWVLYWFNTVSAMLDNATLAAIEIDPVLALHQIVAIIMGLAIAGGILIPGNIPNIVAAFRLRINMKEWAIIGLPIGLAIMIIYFVILLPTLL